MNKKDATRHAEKLASALGEQVYLYVNCDGKWSFCASSISERYGIKRPHACTVMPPAASRPTVMRRPQPQVMVS